MKASVENKLKEWCDEKTTLLFHINVPMPSREGSLTFPSFVGVIEAFTDTEVLVRKEQELSLHQRSTFFSISEKKEINIGLVKPGVTA